jgi:hypothetical protein
MSKLETRDRLSNNPNGAYGQGFATYVSFLPVSVERIPYTPATMAGSRTLPPPVQISFFGHVMISFITICPDRHIHP